VQYFSESAVLYPDIIVTCKHIAYANHLNMKRWGLYCLICLMVCTVASCVKDVIMDAQEKPQVAVVCILSNEPVQELTLLFTKGASQKGRVPVKEAEAILIDESFNEEVGHFIHQGNGVWKLEYCAISAHHYKLEISVPGYEKITAEQAMPRPVRIIARGQFFYKIPGLHFPSLIEGPSFVPNSDDFESLPFGSKVYYVQNLPDPVWLFARNFNSTTGEYTTVEEICTNYPNADDFNLTGSVYEPPRKTDIPNPYIKDSYISELYPLLAGTSIHKGFLRFPAQDLSEKRGWWFSISGSMEGKYNCKDFYQSYYGDQGLAEPLASDEGYLEAIAMSKDLDLYLKDAYHKQEIKASSDFASIYLRDNLYTNIVGGVGIFGATHVRKYQWSDEYEYVDDGIKHTHYAGSGMEWLYIPDDKWPL